MIFDELEEKSKDMDSIPPKEIKMPDLKGSFSELIEKGSSKEVNELDKKFIEFIPDDKEFLDTMVNYYSSIKDVNIREFKINAENIKDAIMNILASRFKFTDIYSIPLMEKNSDKYKEIADLYYNGDSQPYVVQRIVPYELFIADAKKAQQEGRNSIDISKCDWYASVISEMVRYYALSVAEVKGLTFIRILPKKKEDYEKKWKQFHNVLIAIIKEKAELHVYIDSTFNRALWMYQNKGTKSPYPFTTQMYSSMVRKTYHAYCLHKLTMQGSKTNEITTELEQSISPVLKGNWQYYITYKMKKAFDVFLANYECEVKANTYWDLLQEKIDKYHSSLNEEIDASFLSNIVIPPIYQFDVLKAFTDSILLFPKELWRGIDWDDKAIASYNEQAFHYMTSGQQTYLNTPSEKAPFIEQSKVCEFAYGILSVLVDDAIEKGILKERVLYLPLLKGYTISSYNQLQRIKDYMFSINGEEIIKEITGKVIENVDIMKVLEKIPVFNKPSTLNVETKLIIYDENYDWANEFDWSGIKW